MMMTIENATIASQLVWLLFCRPATTYYDRHHLTREIQYWILE